jgi:hypothetical protein
MQFVTAKIALVFVIAVGLSCLTAWWTAHRYRIAMRRLMSAPAGAADRAAAAAPADAPMAPAASLSLADNHRAALRLALVLIAVSCLIALTSAVVWFALSFPGKPIAPKRVAVWALVQLWPVIPALGLVRRWGNLRMLAALVGWYLLCFGVLLWRAGEPRSVSQLMGFLGGNIGVPMMLVAVLCLTDAARAVAPWLLPPFIVLASTSVLGVDLLVALVAHGPHWVAWGGAQLGAAGSITLFAVLPWLLAWWPLRLLGRAIGRAYARKWLSELLVLFTAVWAISLLIQALEVSLDRGFAAVAMFLPLLWIPLVFTIGQRLRAEPGRPPTLLVLRVFQRDAQVQDLFDHVVERWRLSGNTMLIAGTDLADRTLDADDIYTFLDGRLAARFIQTPADVAPRLAAFDMARDADGRFRVNECCCNDTTWQQTLNALVARSDVVLMDLRSFQVHNAGCRYELGALAGAPRLARVVVLTDGDTDRAAAHGATAGAPAERFVWLDTSVIDAGKRREVLASLFVERDRAVTR